MARWTRTAKPTFAHRMEYAGVRLVVALLKRVPRGAAVRFGDAIGALAWRLGIRRRVVVENLAASTGLAGLPPEGGDPDAVTPVARACYRHVGRSFAELAFLPRLSPGAVRAFVRFEGLEHVRAALDRGKGVIALSGHYGSPEVMTVGLARHGFDPHVLVAPDAKPAREPLLP